MQGNIDIFTLLSLVVAVVAILKLRSVLGKRTSDDEARVNRKMRAQQARDAADAAGEKVVKLPGRDRDDFEPQDGAEPALPAIEERVQAMNLKDSGVADGLIAIGNKDRSFDPEHFLNGSKHAYEMVVTGFAESNREMLKDLLSADVFAGFESAIADRESRGERVEQSFVGIKTANIIGADLSQGEASVTVKFLSQLITSTTDKEGQVISGDPQKVQNVTDIWTFAREVSSQDPNWFLVATQAPH